MTAQNIFMAKKKSTMTWIFTFILYFTRKTNAISNDIIECTAQISATNGMIMKLNDEEICNLLSPHIQKLSYEELENTFLLPDFLNEELSEYEKYISIIKDKQLLLENGIRSQLRECSASKETEKYKKSFALRDFLDKNLSEYEELENTSWIQDNLEKTSWILDFTPTVIDIEYEQNNNFKLCSYEHARNVRYSQILIPSFQKIYADKSDNMKMCLNDDGFFCKIVGLVERINNDNIVNQKVECIENQCIVETTDKANNIRKNIFKEKVVNKQKNIVTVQNHKERCVFY
ncbi:uncharacterized protein LOC126901071 isoform X2 [Daktulosphaira vitifoliae]|uniref:uncharacterized protein LOC126901071 isoform X2 n=1 Tax=Daktulosphaira vitifoliae TaxID=58002 RepID=UPI0021AAC80A|nr:uncharacterized protein LOC126901071 isoform X2 [Daktulosphaira vitifoliae]